MVEQKINQKKKNGNIGQRLKKRFLEGYLETSTVKGGALVAGVNRCTVYKWLKTCTVFAAEFESVKEDVVDDLEQEARRRAYEGIDKPIYHQGIRVDVIKEYSDVLLIFLLKGNRPDKYRDKTQHELTGLGGGPIITNITVASEQDKKNVERIISGERT